MTHFWATTIYIILLLNLSWKKPRYEWHKPQLYNSEWFLEIAKYAVFEFPVDWVCPPFWYISQTHPTVNPRPRGDSASEPECITLPFKLLNLMLCRKQGCRHSKQRSNQGNRFLPGLQKQVIKLQGSTSGFKSPPKDQHFFVMSTHLSCLMKT